MKWGLPFSINLLFWSIVGLLRFFDEIIEKVRPGKEIVLFVDPHYENLQALQAAVCIAARNEEKVMKRNLTSVRKMIPLQNCYVVSDGSNDKTAAIAVVEGANVLINKTSLGKARALEELIKRFHLTNRYKYILFLDADVEVDKNYINNALKLLEDKKVACVAGYVKTRWPNPTEVSVKNFIIAYRTRLYSLMQLLLTYGQTWKYTNTTPIIPGFASMYRTSVLKKIKLSIPGIIIEDFNWTFQVQKKHLGKIAHHPRVFAVGQDPQNIDDYIRQVERWNLGFFQAIRTHGVWISFFWFMLLVFIIEVFFASIFFGIAPFIIAVIILSSAGVSLPPPLDVITSYATEAYTILGIVTGLIVVDYTLTFISAIKNKKPIMLFYGLGFIVFRVIDTLILLGTAPRAFFVRSRGVWISPLRH